MTHGFALKDLLKLGKNDRYAIIDPYRTTYSKGMGKFVAITIGSIVAVIAIIVGIVITLNS